MKKILSSRDISLFWKCIHKHLPNLHRLANMYYVIDMYMLTQISKHVAYVIDM